MGNFISTIDLGTGSIRNTIYDESGDIQLWEQEENPVIQPEPGYAEQDPVRWWDVMKETFLDMPRDVKKEIGSITVTSQREGMVPVNEQFEPLSNIIIWLDCRTVEEGKQTERELGRDMIYDVTGLVPNPAWSLSKILWIKKHQSALYQKAWKFLQAEDYFISRLSGQAVSEFSIASRTCMLNVKERKWSQHILNTFDIDEGKMPRLVESGTMIGPIRKEVAREFGLPEDVGIHAGAGDQQAAAVGVGAFDQGVASIGIGTSSAISMTLDSPVPDPQKIIILNCAAIPGKWEYEPPIWNTGGIIKWFLEHIEDKRTGYEELLEGAAGIPPGANGLLAVPYFSGAGSPRWKPCMKGGFYGFTLGHGKNHMLRAIKESIACEIRFNLESIQRSGIPLKKVILSGGASRNMLLCRIIADVLQTEVEVFSGTEASSLGGFILVKAAREGTRDLKKICQRIRTETEIIKPDKNKAGVYDEIYSKYIRLGDLLAEFP